ncbi:c-type cytochrome biogenesis protein CcsB [Nocardioides albus]|uniref:Heme exporter protein C n=1 Tax=Nocardioides albus TaxID=1841 RepID=A0A7W5A223_9ACTN|nr:c-type cytochrome biogenesis protein CcsB [Nocardioides albus]MBB3088273.1 cytochrome c-type biogenesis protein CcsB [Nocardioides albus]GGU42615.1 c-type cytochrome biogenesis protein CcsB [Nocardioides albus]
MSDHTWGVLSNQAITAAGVVYFLALLCALVEWSSWLSRAKATAATKELVGAGAPADEAVATDPADDVREYRAALFGRLSLMLTAIAVVCHLVALVARGMAADPNRVPWGNMYEFTISGSFVVAAAYVVLYRRLKLAWMAPWVLGFTVVVLMLAVVGLYEPVAPLTEALNSYWLVIHVIAAIIATGGFTLGGIASAAYLLKSRFPDATLLARVPELEALDRVSYRIHAFAFPVWTFGVLISGPIWAHDAWGSYWNWDPKEVWAFITWVVYAGYLHARATAGWKGKKAAIVALIGLATLWFNFIGINYFSSTSQHSYAAPAAPAVVELISQGASQ